LRGGRAAGEPKILNHSVKYLPRGSACQYRAICSRPRGATGISWVLRQLYKHGRFAQ